ncbi:MAG: acetyl-CoA carboxylase biotin carboxyl carrier protein subunit [Bacilli bacterium]|nr:acetyl-CoA carboxylase biotin carboxyl carrier protein subunit [Bacilli bacterium]MDD4809229.1 acetyl-CoA carboxylase biotin carboxyl carrier protein subunit [Bacilli bacterium]
MDIKYLRELIETFEKSDLDKLSLELETGKISLEKNINIESKTKSNENEENGQWITSPLVGVLYNTKGNNILVKEGQKVSKGDVLCIIESMKIMNEVISPKDGIVKKINVKNNTSVEAEQKLILIG